MNFNSFSIAQALISARLFESSWVAEFWKMECRVRPCGDTGGDVRYWATPSETPLNHWHYITEITGGMTLKGTARIIRTSMRKRSAVRLWMKI